MKRASLEGADFKRDEKAAYKKNKHITKALYNKRILKEKLIKRAACYSLGKKAEQLNKLTS